MPDPAKYGRDFFPRFDNSRYGRTKKSLLPTIRVTRANSPADTHDVDSILKQNESLKAILSALQSSQAVGSQADVHPFEGWAGGSEFGTGGQAKKQYGFSPREQIGIREQAYSDAAGKEFDIEPRKLQLQANIAKQLSDYLVSEEKLKKPTLAKANRPERKELPYPEPTKPDVPLAAMIASTIAGILDPKGAGHYAAAPGQAALAHADYQDERNLQRFGYDQRRADLAYQDQSQIAEEDANLANQNALIGYQNELAGQEQKRNIALQMIQAQGSQELANLAPIQAQNQKAALLAQTLLGQKKDAVAQMDLKASQTNAQVASTQKMYLDLAKSVLTQTGQTQRQQAGFENQSKLQEDRQTFQAGQSQAAQEAAMARALAVRASIADEGAKNRDKTGKKIKPVDLVNAEKELAIVRQEIKEHDAKMAGFRSTNPKEKRMPWLQKKRDSEEAIKLRRQVREMSDTKKMLLGKAVKVRKVHDSLYKQWGGETVQSVLDATKAGHAGAAPSARSATGTPTPASRPKKSFSGVVYSEEGVSVRKK